MQVTKADMSDISQNAGDHEGIKHGGTDGAMTTTFVPNISRGASATDPGGGTRGVGTLQKISSSGFDVG